MTHPQSKRRVTDPGAARTARVPRVRRRRGISLVLVISVMLILTVVATGFVAFTSQDMRTSQATYEQNETYFLAESGIDYGLFLLKHSMLVFPNPPGVWADGRAQRLYNADVNSNTGTGGLDPTSSLLNINSLTGGQEFVVISDMMYGSGNNWMSAIRCCGTFLLRYSVASTTAVASQTDQHNNYEVTFVSTGYIKRIPTGVTETTIDATTGRPNGFATVGSATWDVLAKRTLQAVVHVNAVNRFGTAVFTGPTVITEVQVKRFNEQFR